MFGSIGVPELVIVVFFLLCSLIVVVWPAGRICRRVGFTPWLGLLAIIPIGNLFLLWFIALSRWPAPDPEGTI